MKILFTTKYNNMKKRLLYFLLLVVSWTNVWGQVPLTSVCIEGMDSSASIGIVRSWKPNFAVAYKTDGTNHYFSIIENYNTTMKTVKFSDNRLVVNDMQILGDTLYFCGSQDGAGYIGCFRINKILDGSPIDAQGKKFSLDPTLPYTVSRMAVYYDNFGTQHVAAFGYWEESVSPYVYRRDFLVEAYFQPDVFTAEWSVCNDDGSFISGPINDVVVTDNYVAFVGVDAGYSTLGIRRVSRNYVLAALHYIYKYNCPMMCPPVATAMNHDDIAVATSYDIYPSSTNRIEIRSFKLGTMNMYDAQGFFVPDKSTAEDIIYSPRAKKLLLVPMLWDGARASYPVVYIDPGRTTPYNTSAVTSTNIQTWQISLHDNDYFLLCGGNKVFAHHIPSLDSDDGCISIDDYEIKAVDMVGFADTTCRLQRKAPQDHMIRMVPTDSRYVPLCVYNN